MDNLLMTKKPKKYQLKARTPFNPEFLPVMQNLRAEGRSLADIALMIGFAGKAPKQWMLYLKGNKEGVAEALDAGTDMADCKLVTTAFDVATGYDVEETEITYIKVPTNRYTPAGQPIIKTVEKQKKVKTKHIKPDPGLLFRMICNRLPDDFNDTQKIDVTKRSVDIHADVTAEIEGFAGKLIEQARKRKKVESKVIETEKEKI